MRTTLNIPDNLMNEVQTLSGANSKTTAIVIAMQDYINRKKIEKIRSLRGKLEVDINLETSRGTGSV